MAPDATDRLHDWPVASTLTPAPAGAPWRPTRTPPGAANRCRSAAVAVPLPRETEPSPPTSGPLHRPPGHLADPTELRHGPDPHHFRHPPAAPRRVPAG